MMKLSRPQRLWLYGTFAALWLSGVAWYVLHRMSVEHELWDASRRLESWLLRIHGAAAMAFLVVFGALIPTHIREGLAGQRKRPSGGTVIGVMALLIVTGYLLYYAGNEAARAAVSFAHTWVGVVSPLVMLVHLLDRRGKRINKRAAE